MYGIIYKATGPTGLVYVGQTTVSLARRKADHAFRTKKGDRRTAFHVALLEHGFSTFAWDQIDTAENAGELDVKEKHWIVHYQSDDPAHGYNGTSGGINYTPTPEHRLKNSQAHKGKKLSVEHRRKLSEMRKGKPHSPEHQRKINEALRSPEVQQRIKETKKHNKGIREGGAQGPAHP